MNPTCVPAQEVTADTLKGYVLAITTGEPDVLVAEIAREGRIRIQEIAPRDPFQNTAKQFGMACQGKPWQRR